MEPSWVVPVSRSQSPVRFADIANIINKEIKCEYIDEIIVKGRSHPVKTFQVKDLTPNETENNDLNYETDGFSVILDEEKIKNKNEIIDHLEKSLDHLKK